MANKQIQITNNPLQKIEVINTIGDGSNFNYTATTSKHGDNILTSDISNVEIHKTDTLNGTQGNRITDTKGDNSNTIKGNNENVVRGNNVTIVGNPDILHFKLHERAEKAKIELVSARSGFFDNRNDVIPPLDLMSIDIPKSIATMGKVPSGIKSPEITGNVFLDLEETAKYSAIYYSSYAKESAIEISKTMAMRNPLSIAKEKLDNLKEGNIKEKLKLAIKSGDVTKMLASPSTEKIKKESNYNEEEYQKIAIQTQEELLLIEKNL